MHSDDALVLRMRAYGLPISQGSKTLVRGRMIESSSKRLRPWREQVRQAAHEAAAAGTLEGPVGVRLAFIFPRPASHYGTGKNSETLRKGAPGYMGIRPDIDKVTRAVLDSLTDAGWWRDDSQVAVIEAAKVYGSDPGVEAQAWTVQG